MRFNPKARLDTGRTRDAGRGGGGGGGGGLGGGRGGAIAIPGGLKAGGGIGGILVILVVVALNAFLGGNGGGGTGGLGGGSALDASRMAQTDRYASCRSGADANDSADCSRVAVENSLYDFWSDTLPQQSTADFRPEQAVVTFTDQVSTGCGAATAAVGPFYCPPDMTIYLDTTFFDNVLERQLGGPSGAFVEPYVLAHEYGHHIQNLLGTMGRVKTQQGPRSDSVRLELQADCYAGMWAGAATTTQDADGQVLISDLTEQDVREAIAAATAVGDDTIQEASGGRVNPEQWTHGSSTERVRWFRTGFETGSLKACDTFARGAL